MSNTQPAKSIQPVWRSLSVLPNVGVQPKIQLPPILSAAFATQVHIWLQPGEMWDLVIPCCRLACRLLGRSSQQDPGSLWAPVTGGGHPTHPSPPRSWTPLTIRGADTGSGLCPVVHVEVLPWEGRGYWGKGPWGAVS